MSKAMIVMEQNIRTFHFENEDYICITDIAKIKNPLEPKDVVKNWMRTRNTLEYLGLWEKLNNPNFKGVEFDPLLSEAGANAFTMSPSRWIETTNSIGIVVKNGKNGGTFAQKDIAFKFASWVSTEFELYLIREFQRLKAAEQAQLGWSVKRELSKINYFKPSAATKFTWALSRRKVKRYEVAPLPYPHRRCQTELDSRGTYSTRNFLRICQ